MIAPILIFLLPLPTSPSTKSSTNWTTECKGQQVIRQSSIGGRALLKTPLDEHAP